MKILNSLKHYLFPKRAQPKTEPTKDSQIHQPPKSDEVVLTLPKTQAINATEWLNEKISAALTDLQQGELKRVSSTEETEPTTIGAFSRMDVKVQFPSGNRYKVTLESFDGVPSQIHLFSELGKNASLGAQLYEGSCGAWGSEPKNGKGNFYYSPKEIKKFTDFGYDFNEEDSQWGAGRDYEERHSHAPEITQKSREFFHLLLRKIKDLP